MLNPTTAAPPARWQGGNRTRGHRIILTVLALVLVAGGCGGDDDDATTPTATTARSGTDAGPTASPTDDGATDTDPNDESALGGDPSGMVTMTVGGDIVFEGDIVECTLVEPDVQFLAQGETAEIEVSATGGGAVAVAVSGGYEFEGQGTATFDPDTTDIDSGDVLMTGSGAQPDDSAPVEDFTVEAQITSC